MPSLNVWASNRHSVRDALYNSARVDLPNVRPGYRWYVASLLFLVGVFNWMDRQILSILLESIKVELRASDSAMGLLTGFAFVSFYALASLPIARLADS